MKHLIAYAFSDLHINLWAKFNQDNRRTSNHFEVLFRLKRLGNKHNVPILFCGDLFHKPESIDQDLMVLIQNNFDRIFNQEPCPEFYCISGNHDMKNISELASHTYSWIEAFSRMYPRHLHNMDMKHWMINNYTFIHCIPYIDHNTGINYTLANLELKPKFKHILMLHTDYPGAEDTDGRKIDSVENLNINTLNKFDLVLCGHIHKPQRLSKKVYMLGAPLQQRRTDRNCKLGYWEIYDDMSMKFVAWEDFPKFIDVESEDKIKDDGNYYTILPKKASITPVSNNKITKQLSKKTLARKYMRVKGIKDKRKKNLLVKLLNNSQE